MGETEDTGGWTDKVRPSCDIKVFEIRLKSKLHLHVCYHYRLEKELEIAKNLFENAESPEDKNEDSSKNICDCDRCRHLQSECRNNDTHLFSRFRPKSCY